MIWKSEIYSHLLITCIYFFLVSVLRLVNGGLGMLGVLGILEVWGGAILGTFFLDIDHLIYWFATNTEKEDSKEAKQIVGEIRDVREFGEIGKKFYLLLKRAHFTHTRLIFHSALGQVVLLVLAFYLLTSGGSIFGSAFIMAINLHLLKDEWSDYKKDKNHLADWLFWQVKDSGIKNHTGEYLIGASLIFLGLTIFFI